MKKVFYILLLSTMLFYSCGNNGNDAAKPENIENTASIDTDDTEIKFDDAVFDFKEVKQGNEVTRVFTFTNIGSKPLLITEVRPSCGCTTPTYTNAPVAPGKKGSVTISFNSTGFQGNVYKSASISGNFPSTEIKFKANVIK